mgnify:CR=1 FL=1
MTVLNTSLLQANLANTLNTYRDWQKRNNKQNVDFMTFLKSSGAYDLKYLGQLWENALEGGGDGDGIQGNTISFDKYFSQGNEVYFQSQNGSVIKMNFNDGTVQQLSQKELAAQFGIDAEVYDYIDFGKNTLDIYEFSFTGLGDGKADKYTSPENKWTYQELDVANGWEMIQNYANKFKEDYGEKALSNLKNLFGSEQGAAHNVIYSKSGESAIVLQNGRAFEIKYDKTTGQLKRVEINASTVGNYMDIDKSKTIEGLEFKITDDNKLEIKVKYKGQNGGSGSTQTGTTRGSGDPHFYYNGVHMFDLQGAGGNSNGTYQLLKGKNFELDADFVKCYGNDDAGATVMGAQHLKVTTEAGIVEVDYKSNGTYTVKLNGEQITDPSKYGLTITKSGSAVTVKYDNRTFYFNGNTVNVDKIEEGETGVLTQVTGMVNGISKTDYNQIFVRSPGLAMAAAVTIVNGGDEYIKEAASDFVGAAKRWGISKIANAMSGASSNLKVKPNAEYTISPNDITGTVHDKAEFFARLAYAALADNSCPDDIKTQVVANWLKLSSEAMIADMKSTDNSIASNYKAGRGYSASQWNEFTGTIAFAKQADIDKNGTIDKTLDIDGDGFTDGFDLNGDGILQDSEKVLFNFGDVYRSTGSFLFDF